jgi:pyridoxine 4-dehydrogenase
VPLADQIGALRRLQEEGKVRHVGLSEVTIDEIAEAEQITSIASVQNRYNLNDRASSDELEYCEGRGIAFIPWLPVAPTAATDAADAVTALAKQRGATRTQIALAWLLHSSPVIVPIPGTSSRVHLEENIAAASLSLSPDEVAEIDGSNTVA